jgi:tetratricopeptide (TPR) repeat protein
MEKKTYSLIQQAERDLFLGKPGAALEQYLKIHEIDPEDATIISAIADLSMQMADGKKALTWYRKLVTLYERQGMLANATAVYRKILKVAPNDQETMNRLAELYEQQGQLANAKLQYKLSAHLASQCLTPLSSSIYLYKKICTLDPQCHESHLRLAQLLEQAGRMDDALAAYFRCAWLYAERENIPAASTIVEKIIQLNPVGQEFLRIFYRLLCKIDMAEAGIGYILSLDTNQDPTSATQFAILLDPANRTVLAKYLQRVLRQNSQVYPAAIRLLEECLVRLEWDFGLDLADAMLEASLRLRQTGTLKKLIRYIHDSAPTNIRALNTLVTLLVRLSDEHELEWCLKKLAILHLQQGSLNEAREDVHKLVAHCHNRAYLEIINWLNDCQCQQPPQIRHTFTQLIQALEQGTWEASTLYSSPTEEGASALDLGLGLRIDDAPAQLFAPLPDLSAHHSLPHP